MSNKNYIDLEGGAIKSALGSLVEEVVETQSGLEDLVNNKGGDQKYRLVAIGRAKGKSDFGSTEHPPHLGKKSLGAYFFQASSDISEFSRIK